MIEFKPIKLFLSKEQKQKLSKVLHGGPCLRAPGQRHAKVRQCFENNNVDVPDAAHYNDKGNLILPYQCFLSPEDVYPYTLTKVSTYNLEFSSREDGLKEDVTLVILDNDLDSVYVSVDCALSHDVITECFVRTQFNNVFLARHPNFHKVKATYRHQQLLFIELNNLLASMNYVPADHQFIKGVEITAGTANSRITQYNIHFVNKDGSTSWGTDWFQSTRNIEEIELEIQCLYYFTLFCQYLSDAHRKKEFFRSLIL